METKTETKTDVDAPVEHKYAILQEVNEEEGEAWLYFIRYTGNEENLKHLNKQLEQVRWRLEDGFSTFDLELNYLVSEQTAKEMTKVDLNHFSFHRKFDGKLQKIDLGLKDTDKNSKKMKKVNDILAYGDIDKFIDKEDIDPEDMNDDNGQETSSSSESESESSSDSEEEDEKHHKKHGKLPNVVSKDKKKIDIPRYALAKKKHH